MVSISCKSTKESTIISTIAALVNNSCNCTYVIWQGNEDKLPEDDTFDVETCRSLIIYVFIIIVLSLADLQVIKNARYMY